MDYAKVALKEVAKTPRDALRIVRRHWAPLLTLLFVGHGLNALFIWLASAASVIAAVLGALILPLASLSLVVSILACLWVIAPSLKNVSLFEGGGIRMADLRTNLTTIGALLVPFLGVYAASGWFSRDLERYQSTTFLSNFMTSLFERPELRTDFSGTSSLIVIGAAIALRFLLKGTGWTRGSWWKLTVFAYVEALWMITGFAWLAANFTFVRGFVFSREFYRWWLELQDAFPAVSAVSDFVQDNINAVVVLPVSWLLLGSTVYQASKRVEESEAPSKFWSSRMQHVAQESMGQVTGSYQSMIDSLGFVLKTGAVPVMTFCLFYILADVPGMLFSYAWRMIQPRPETPLEASFYDYPIMIAQVMFAFFSIALIAPAVDRMIQALNETAETTDQPDAEKPVPAKD